MKKQKSKTRMSIGLAAYFLFVLALSDVSIQGQTPTPSPTPKSAEVLRLEEEKAQAELRKAIAEANKAELEAKFPKPTSSPLAGATTINDNAIIESQMVAYASMARAANRIVDALNKQPNLKIARLAVFNEDDIKLLLSYKVSTLQIDLLRKSYCQLLSPSQTDAVTCPRPPAPDTAPPSFIGASTIARSLLGTFVDLTALLRTNVDIKGQTFDIDEGPLVAEIFRAARRTKEGLPSSAEYYYPKIFAPDIGIEKEYEILGLLNAVVVLRNTAGKLLADLEKNTDDIGKAETKVKNLELSIEQLASSLAEKKTKLSVLLKAHCRRMPAADRSDPDGMEARLNHYCPALSGEYRERIFEVVAEIKAIDSDLGKARGSLVKANAALATLETERANLWGGFLGQLGGAPQNALAVADAAAQLKARNAQVDQLVSTLAQATAPGTPNTLTSYIKAENLSDILNKSLATDQKSYWLQVKVVKAGGNNRIKTNLVWDIFTGGNRVSHSGGVIVEYILFDTSGKALGSDTITEYTNYIKAGKVKKLPTSTIDDCLTKPGTTICKE